MIVVINGIAKEIKAGDIEVTVNKALSHGHEVLVINNTYFKDGREFTANGIEIYGWIE